MDIKKFLKSDKNIIVDVDGVEYLLDDEAIDAMEKDNEDIELLRLYDSKRSLVRKIHIEKSLLENGVVDYLDK